MRKPITIVLTLFVAIGFSQLRRQRAADHFKAVGPDKVKLGRIPFSPERFRGCDGQSSGSQWSYALFTVPTRAVYLYDVVSSIAGTNVDAVVNDTTFTLVDGTECYEPQNEQNIVVNPTNGQNIVTSATTTAMDSRR